jgi:hypothetical protein
VTRTHTDEVSVAGAWCFIASSVNFPVRHEPVVAAGASDTVRYAPPHQGHRSDP